MELPESYDGLMEKTYSWLQAEETASKGKLVTFIGSGTGDKTQNGRPWEGSGKKNSDKRDRFNPYKEPNLGILQSLTKSPREILATKEVGKAFTKPPKMVSKARDTSKYCEFHQDYGHDTNACRELKIQIEEEGASENHEYRRNDIPSSLKQGSIRRPYPHKCASLRKASRKCPARLRSYVQHHLRALFLETQKEVRERRKDVYTILSGFSDEQVNPLGETSL
ncbi:hypothetical protein Tco_0261835 [Tanacetum coccineum]